MISFGILIFDKTKVKFWLPFPYTIQIENLLLTFTETNNHKTIFILYFAAVYLKTLNLNLENRNFIFDFD